MTIERSLVLVKPDGVQRGLIGRILARLEERGLKLIGLKLIRISEALGRQHYAEHVDKPFFPGLLEYMTSGPVVVAAFEGPGAVTAIRNAMGATNPLEASPGTVRGDYALEVGRNLVHGSDSVESGRREIALFFSEDELLPWDRDTDRWIYE